MSKAFESSLDTQNFAIIDGYAKAVSVLSRSHTPLCSISGGSDSDIVLDVIQNVDEKKKVHYFWICLLYTSPSPRDMRRSRMPSSA